MTTDCSDVASGAFILAAIAAAVGFALGWWINKAKMLQELAEQKKDGKP
jgi:hypothetical protein